MHRNLKKIILCSFLLQRFQNLVPRGKSHNRFTKCQTVSMYISCTNKQIYELRLSRNYNLLSQMSPSGANLLPTKLASLLLHNLTPMRYLNVFNLYAIWQNINNQHRRYKCQVLEKEKKYI